MEDLPENAQITSVNGKEVVDKCESCDKLLFDETDHIIDFGGNAICNKCVELLQEEF